MFIDNTLKNLANIFLYKKAKLNRNRLDLSQFLFFLSTQFFGYVTFTRRLEIFIFKAQINFSRYFY